MIYIEHTNEPIVLSCFSTSLVCSTGCPKKPPKTIENDLLLEFQYLALS